MADRTGQRFGDYQLIRFLGEGTFGDVYFGEHVYQKTPAAVKAFKTKLTPNKMKDFINEVRTVLLRHPNIVQIIDFGIGEDDIPFLVMEYAPNGTLLQRHPRGTALPLATIVTYVKQIAAALQYAHDQRRIHRDVKPENMLFGPNNEIWLSDFGIAAVAHNTHSQRTEDSIGTALYMAPEQFQGKPRPASDQYALGIIIYEWLCGEPPFGGNVLQLMYQHIHEAPASLREKLSAIPVEVEQVVMTALAKDPDKRFASVQAFANAFAQACQMKRADASPFQAEPSISTTEPKSPIAAPSNTPLVFQPSSSTLLPTRSSSSHISPPITPLETTSLVPGTLPVEAPPLKTTSAVPGMMTLPTKTESAPLSNVPVTMAPGRKKANGRKIAIGSVSLLLVIVLLLVLIPYLGRVNNAQGGTQATSQSNGQQFNLTPPSAPPVPKVIYIISTPTSSGDSNQYTLSAVRTSDGATLWHTQWNNESYLRPTIMNGVVYIAADHYNSCCIDGGFVHALRASDGTTLWNYHVVTGQNGVGDISIADGVVYAGAADFFYALRASDGSLLWKYQAVGDFFSAPKAVVNGVAYMVSAASTGDNCYAYAFRVSDGTLLWKYSLKESGYVSQSPIVANGIVYIPSPISSPRFLYPYDPSKDIHQTNSAVYAVRASDGSFLWKYEIDKDSSFLKLEVDNGILYASAGSQRNSSGVIYALRADNGAPLWHYQVHVDNSYGGLTEAVVSGPIVYIASQGNNATLYALKANDGSLYWQHQLGSGYDPIIVPAGSILYTGINLGTGSVDALRVNDGTPIWSYKLDDGVDISGIVFAGTTLYVGIYGYNGPGGVYGHNGPGAALLALQTSKGTLLRQSQESIISMIAS
jgi:serine/threonine protein kinase